MNTFAQQRQRLAESEGEHITDWQMSCLLGIARSTVSQHMKRPDHEIRPALLLAIEHAIVHGYDQTDAIIDTPGQQFDEMLSELPMPYTQAGHLLGLAPSTLRKMRSLGSADVPRRYYLAAKVLHERLAAPWYQRLDEHAEAFEL
jgi:hypothetical protein